MNELKSKLEEKFKNYGPIIKMGGFNPCPINNKIPDFANSILFPEVRGTSIYIEFWEEQIDRCINGYATGGLKLPGPYYEYLNFSTIDGPRGPTTPYFVDLHYGIVDTVDQAKKAHMPGVIIPKKRRGGLSFLGVMYINHGIRFIDRYRAGVAAGLETYCDGFRLKLYRTYNITAPEFMINHLIRSSDSFKIGYEEKTPQGFQDKIYAEIFFKTMKDKAEKMEGEYFNDVFLEESGQFPLVGDARESIYPALKDGETFIGFMFVYGCVCAGTKVWDNKGNLVNIETLKQQDGILCYDGKTSSQGIINHMNPPAKKQCYRIETSGGNFIECSHDHPILTTHRKLNTYRNGKGTRRAMFKKAEDIKVGDELASIGQVSIFGKKRISNARILGLLIGDGNYSINNTPQICVADQKIRDYLKKKIDYKVYKSFILKDGTVFENIGLKGYHTILKEHGMYGQVKQKKRLPLDIDQFDEHSICELLGGYYDADGNVSYNLKKNSTRIVLTSICFELLDQVKYLLIKLGITSHITKEKRGIKDIKISSDQLDYVYRLYVSRTEDVLKFRNKIKFLCKHKQDVLDKAISLKKGLNTRHDSTALIYMPNENYPEKGEFFNDSKQLSNLKFSKVTKIESIGEQTIYNLNVSETHTYLANGFVTANTGGEMQKSSKQFKQMWHAADILGLVKLFIPGKRYYVPYVRRAEGQVITPNLDAQYPDLKPEQLLGCEDVKAADESIDRTLAEYAQLPDKKEFVKFKQNYPKTVEDVFTSSGTNHFNTEKLYMQSYHIESNDRKWTEWVYDWIKDEHGDIIRPFQVKKELPKKSTPDWKKVKIFKDAMRDIRDLDVAGVDGYNEDKTDTSKSLGAIVVVRQYDKFPFLAEAKDLRGPVPIALYYQRPPVKELFWEIGLQMSVDYNLLGNTMISAEADAMIQYYKGEGAVKYLARRPKSFDAPNSKLNHDFGVKMTQSSKPKMLGLVQSWIEYYIQYCYFLEIINDAISYDFAQIGTDWDSVDAMGNALMRIIDMNKKIQYSSTPTKVVTNIGLPSYEEIDGEITRIP